MLVVSMQRQGLEDRFPLLCIRTGGKEKAGSILNQSLYYSIFRFKICNSEDIPLLGVKSIRIFGKDLVVFRSSDGKLGLLDAYCPHLGAHLGIGGAVNPETGCLACPFHGWEFRTDGKCQKIPCKQRH